MSYKSDTLSLGISPQSHLNYLSSSFFNSSNTTSLITLIYVPFIPDERDSITPALSNFLNAFTITDLVIPTLSAILLATSIPSSPSSTSNICLIASNSEADNVLIADLTICCFLTSSAFSSLTYRIISSPTTVVPYSQRIISSIS